MLSLLVHRLYLMKDKYSKITNNILQGLRTKRVSKRFLDTLSKNLKMYVGMEHKSFLRFFPVVSKKDVLLYKIYLSLFNFFEHYFDVHIYIQPPPSLKNIKPELWNLMYYASKLKEEGILSHVHRLTGFYDEPSLFRYKSVIAGEDDDSFHGVGHSLFSEEKALLTSLGEVVERYCFRNFSPAPSQIKNSSYKEIKDDALDPFSFSGTSEEFRRKSVSSRLQPFTDEDVFRWVKGYSLTQNKKIWIPWQPISTHPSINKMLLEKKEPIIRLPISTGSAAGEKKEDAIYRGICEIIERDSFMITYLNTLSPYKIKSSDFKNKEIISIRKQLDKYGLDFHIMYLPTDTPCHVVMAVLVPRNKDINDRPHFSIGMKSDFNLDTAVIGATSEALNARIAIRGMLKDVDLNSGPEPDDKEAIGQLDRLYMWHTRPELFSKIEFLWKGKYINFKDIPSFPFTASYEDKVKIFVNHFKKQNYEVAYVENSTPAVRKISKKNKYSFRSFFVIIPKMQPMHLFELMPYFSGERIKSVPKKLNYKVDDSINTFPHPFP